MRSFWRSLLVWLMVLALPLQGLAGTAMQHCADQVDRTVQRPVAAAAQHEHGPLVGQVVAAAAADGAHHHGAADELEAAALADSQHSSAPEADHQCSACAACCSALGLPSRVVPLTPPRVAATSNALPLLTVDSFVPAGLDRPPRSQAA